jgi:hypothetical protein
MVGEECTMDDDGSRSNGNAAGTEAAPTRNADGAAAPTRNADRAVAPTHNADRAAAPRCNANRAAAAAAHSGTEAAAAAAASAATAASPATSSAASAAATASRGATATAAPSLRTGQCGKRRGQHQRRCDRQQGSFHRYPRVTVFVAVGTRVADGNCFRAASPICYLFPPSFVQAAVAMKKKRRRTYEPRVFDGRIITSDEIERIHKEVLEFENASKLSPIRCVS